MGWGQVVKRMRTRPRRELSSGVASIPPGVNWGGLLVVKAHLRDPGAIGDVVVVGISLAPMVAGHAVSPRKVVDHFEPIAVVPVSAVHSQQ